MLMFWLYSLEIHCNKWLHLKPSGVINHTEISSFIYQGNSLSITAIFSIVRFILITGRNMNKTIAVWCYHTCAQQWYFEIFWKVIFVNGFTETFILQWHGDMAYAENRSQLVSIVVKVVPSYLKQTIQWSLAYKKLFFFI